MSSNGLELTIPRRLFGGLVPEGSLGPRVEDLPSCLPLLLASLLEEVVVGAVFVALLSLSQLFV